MTASKNNEISLPTTRMSDISSVITDLMTIDRKKAVQVAHFILDNLECTPAEKLLSVDEQQMQDTLKLLFEEISANIRERLSRGNVSTADLIQFQKNLLVFVKGDKK